MFNEDGILAKLTNQFSYLADTAKIVRQKRIFAQVEYAQFAEVFDYAVKQLGFIQLSAITGLDEGDKLSFIYHLSMDSGVMLNLKTSAPKDNPQLKTVTPYFSCADLYERELVDLLGAKVEGLKIDFRYPLTDDWPVGEFPLRKDWKSK